jgi:two-component system phosphate regulon sensor histidine kinase PhoR
VQGLSFLRSRFFWNLFASCSAVLVFTAVVIALLVEKSFQRDQRTDLEATLRDQCLLLEPLALRELREGGDPGVASELARLGRETGLRITLIRADGSVAADSHENAERMDDHGQRPEVVAARASGFGVAQRFSDTVRSPFLYVAKAVPDSTGQQAFLRVALPVREIRAEVAATRRSILVGTAIGLLAALVLTLLLARRLSAPIAAVTRAAQGLRAGRFDTRIALHRKDELGMLAETMNALATEISGRIATISKDEAQLRAMLAGMVEGVIAVDEEDRITFCNRAALDFLDIERDPVGARLWEVVAIAELDDLLAEARVTNSIAQRELQLLRGTRERAIQVHVSPYGRSSARSHAGASPGRGGLVMVFHDVSELRRLERIRRDFVANVSHELKTPLTSIQGFVETLLTGAVHDQEKNVQFLQRIESNVARLSALVSDLLSLAQVEAQEGRIELVPVDWRDVVIDVMGRHRDALARKGLESKIVGLEHPLVVLGDREGMTQVLENLLDNAIKYTASGAVRIELAQSHGSAALVVADTGVGIPRADLERIFERFYRVDRARSRELGGTGLGLAIVKHRVRSMAGEVRVESELGRGTRFTVELPLA